MDIVLTLLEQWGLYLLAGTISIYFGWNLLAFLQSQHVSFRHDPILTVTTFGWGSIWLIGNGVGNALFIFGLLAIIEDIVSHQTRALFPVLPGSEAVVFLLGLMPSLYQFRYQADPGYLDALPLARRLIAITLTIADGVLCAVGWYWWLLPPLFTQGAFEFPFDRTLFLGVLGWGIFASYVAQYMAHMQLLDLLGIAAPTYPNPLTALWQSIHTRLSGTPQDPVASPTRRRPERQTRHAYRAAPDAHDTPFDEWEVQP